MKEHGLPDREEVKKALIELGVDLDDSNKKESYQTKVILDKMQYDDDTYDAIGSYPEKEAQDTADMVQANEDAYFDNFCQENNI